MRVGVYIRISDDKDGTSTATERQRQDCLAYSERNGWEVADIFEDVDLSAFQRRTKRPEFERMIEAVRSKIIDGVLAWKMDRLTRRQRDFVRLDEACEDAGAFIVTMADAVDTRTSAGRFVAELLVSMARMESENNSVRSRRKARENAEAGKSHGGLRPYGYAVSRKAIIEDEAEIIRECVQRVRAGESIRGICLDLERRRVKTSTGRLWKQKSLTTMLLSPALAGLRIHNGVISTGSWPAVLAENEWREVQLILSDPARRHNPGGARTYLLTGYTECGVCGEPLIARSRGRGIRRYACVRDPGNPQRCGHISRLAEPVEKLVAESIFVALDGVDLKSYADRGSGDCDTAVLEAIRADEAALAELSHDYYQERLIDRATFFQNRDALISRLEAKRAMVSRGKGGRMLATLVDAGARVREEWQSRSLDWRRAVVASLVDKVVINAATRGSSHFDPDAIEVRWRF